MKTITDWYKEGTGIQAAVKHFSDFITNELIVDPNIEFGEVSSDCCVTVNVSNTWKMSVWINNSIISEQIFRVNIS